MASKQLLEISLWFICTVCYVHAAFINPDQPENSSATAEELPPPGFTLKGESLRLFQLRHQGVAKLIYDPKHGVRMGIPFHDCDDGHVNITLDWDGNPDDFTCSGLKMLPTDEDLPSEEVCVPTPDVMSGHWCMFHHITYDEPIPTFGDHRPIWPKFGEYTYLPRERFIHNLEHGAVALFYHPCAKPWLVDEIRKILVSCMRRYIIAANPNVSEEKPLLLAAWGCKLHMASVDEKRIVRFIRKRAMIAPESHTVTQGYYEYGLIRESSLPVKGSDMHESNLCPTYDENIR